MIEPRESTRYLVTLALFTALLALPAQYVLDPIANPDELATQMREVFDDRPADVLFFGDSVITAFSICDSGPALIPDVLAQMLGREVVTIAHWAYSPIVYQDYVKLLRTTAHRPRLVVLPVNVRVFSEQFYRNPDFHFRQRRMRVRRAALGLVPGDFPGWLLGRVREEIDDELYHRAPVEIDGKVLGSNDDIERRAKIDEVLECLDGPYDYHDELKLRFTYHYMGRIPEDHPVFADLERTVEELKALGIPVLAYITPIDVEEGTRYVGPRFATRVAENVATVASALDRLEIPYENLYLDVGAEDFIDKAYACEHMNQVGRARVAERLARRIRSEGLLADPAQGRGSSSMP